MWKPEMEGAWPSFHSGIPQDAIPESPGIVSMDGDPDFLITLGMNEQAARSVRPDTFRLRIALVGAG